MNNNKSPLGRGLSSLIPNKTLLKNNDLVKNNANQTTLSIDLISSNPFQPRVIFNESDLINLSESIKDKGVLQPLIVSFDEQKREYQLIAGERRLRAAKLAGLLEVPVIIKTKISDQEKAELALIENIQRQDLNPIEKAKGFKDLQEKFNFTQEEIAKQLNLSRSSVANILRYLSLPTSVQLALSNGQITEGHAKIIAGMDDPVEQELVLENILNNSLNVRQTEKVIKKEPNSSLNIISNDIKSLVNNFSQKLNNKVEIRKKGKRYILTLNFFSEDEIRKFTNSIQ